MIIDIAQSTGWIAHTLRSPHIPSTCINVIHSTQKNSAKERSSFLQSLGKRVFRRPLLNDSNESADIDRTSNKSVNQEGRPNHIQRNKDEISIFCLGGVKQVGRSCFVVVTTESKVMLDCGINPGEPNGLSAYPTVGLVEF